MIAGGACPVADNAVSPERPLARQGDHKFDFGTKVTAGKHVRHRYADTRNADVLGRQYIDMVRTHDLNFHGRRSRGLYPRCGALIGLLIVHDAWRSKAW